MGKFSAGVQRDNTVEKWLIFALSALFSLRVRPVRVDQMPWKDKNRLFLDSSTSTVEISIICKAAERGVLNVHRAKITRQMTEIARFEACCPLCTDASVVFYSFLS